MNLEKLLESSHRIAGYSLTGTFGGTSFILGLNEDYKIATVSFVLSAYFGISTYFADKSYLKTKSFCESIENNSNDISNYGKKIISNLNNLKNKN